jgi:phosphohistidine phosphatase SixA
MPPTACTSQGTGLTPCAAGSFGAHSNLNSRVRSFLLCLVVLLALSSGCALADDEQVWAALKEGGKVILLRHTHVVIREGIGRLAPGNCAAEVNLSPRGVEQAKRLGETFRAHGIAVGEVLTSPYCRCIDTGRLAFGRATPVQYLMPPGVVSDEQTASNNQRVLREILNHRGPSNLVMITHDLNIANILLEPSVEMGEFFVLQPNGADFTIIGEVHLSGR